MTKDEIIAIGVEAGLIRVGDGWTEPHRWGLSEIEAFANSVYALAAEREREACAKACENLAMQQDYDVRDECAAAIRAMGNT